MTFSKKSAVLIATVIKITTSKTYDSIVSFYTSDVLKPYIKSEKRFFALDFLYKSEMLFIQNDPEKAISNIYDDIQKATAEFSKESGVCPKIIAIKNIGIYCIGSSKANTNAVYDAFLLSIKKIPPSKTLKVMMSSNAIFSDNILKGKVVIITGAAQGFGKGIATEMAKKGAYVVISDINESGIIKLATSLCETYGVGTAIAVRADVTRETDIIKLVETAVLTYGGVDVLINNAGIVKAGSLDDMTLSDFELVTKINYTAYFLCTKHVSKIMKLAHKFNQDNLSSKNNIYNQDRMFDIIQINSKSGLCGSKNNFAYGGSKFGGIGLTQSFALELAEHNIKVNSVCPGNYLDGELWQNPENGLLVQYLNAGKVKNAKTTADVYDYYKSQVPLNKGVTIQDLMHAITYLITQQNETGQSLPLTGGQIML